MTVTDEEVEADLNQQRENNSRTGYVVDRPVQDGDIAVIDYEGFATAKPLKAARATNYTLTIGSHSFIDTLKNSSSERRQATRAK